MRKMMIAALAALCLSACAGGGGLGGIPAAPVEIADQTQLDETGARGVELAYKAFRTALELAVDYGVLKGPDAARAAKLDNDAYSLVNAARAAYSAGNARSYKEAVDAALAAVGSATNALKGN